MNLEGELEPQPLSARADAGLGKFIALFAAGWFLDFIGLGIMIQLSFHEFGHAVAAWLSGRWAIPIPIAAITFWGQERSPIISLLVAGGLVWAAKVAWRRERLGVLVVATVGLLIMADFAFLIPESDVEMWGIFSGVAGEIILSSACICAYFWEVSPKYRWDFWRYPRARLGRFLVALLREHVGGDAAGPGRLEFASGDAAVAHNPLAYLEWLANTPGGTDQDAYRLVHTHHWTTAGMAAGYHGIAAATLLAIVLCAALSLIPKKPRQFTDDD